MLRLGFITELLSKPIRYGYMNGIALTVLISQLPKLFGFSIEADGPLRSLWAIGDGGLDRQASTGRRFGMGVGTLAVILLLKGSKLLPGVLIAVIGATVVVGMFDLSANGGRRRARPAAARACPRFAIPWIGVADLGPVLIGGAAVALVSFADTSVLSRTYAARLGHHVDPNQEMVGLGAANLAAGFFQGFPISSSSSRTPVAEAAGAKTQLTGVVGALGVAALLVAAPDLLQHLPTPRWRPSSSPRRSACSRSPTSAGSSASSAGSSGCRSLCFVGVAVFGAIPGIGLAIVIAVIEFLWDGWRPHSACWAAPTASRAITTSRAIPTRGRSPAWCCSAGMRRCSSPMPSCSRRGSSLPWPPRRPRCARVVVAAEPVTSVDVTAADALAELDDKLGGGRHRAVLRRAEGSGQGQAEALRTVRAVRRRRLLPHHRRSRRCLLRSPWPRGAAVNDQ